MAETPEVARPGPVANRKRRQEILDAAGRSFRRRGFARTTMNTIGKDVGVAAAALYWYFPSKEVILSEYLEGMLRAFVDAVESTLAQLPEDTPIGEKLRTALETHIRYHQSRPEFQDSVHTSAQPRESLPSALRQRVIQFERQFLDIYRGLVSEGIRVGQFDRLPVTPTAFAVIALAQHAATWYDPEGELSVDELARLYGDLAVRMVSRRS